MYEIELKAHVADEEAVRQCLRSFARPLGVIDKDDTYYRLNINGKTASNGGFDTFLSANALKNTQPLNNLPLTTNHLPLEVPLASHVRPYLTCRIREETYGTDSTGNKEVLFTYKRKSLVKNDEGAAIEVNDENECTISNKSALETMLLDAGFTVSHRKHKRAEGYMAATPCGEAHIELCAVPPLGNFLEIEIINEKHDDETVARAKQAIKDIFTKCGIPHEAIEERYYTQMLEEMTPVGSGK